MSDAPSTAPPERILTLATRVTLLRILGIPIFVILTWYYLRSIQAGRPDDRLRIGALSLFAAIALTDALDGYLARSRGEITRLGRILDPLADKILLLSATILLTRPSLPALQPQLPVYLTASVISRDVLLVIGFFVIHHLIGTIEVCPRFAGKASTFLLMTAIVWALAQGPLWPFHILCAAATVFTVLAGFQYLLDGRRLLEHGAVRAPPSAPRSDGAQRSGEPG